MIKKYEIKKIGEIETSEEEDMALALHPKCSVMERLVGDDLEFEKETAYAKARIQIGKEIEERLEGEKGDAEITKEEKDIKRKADEIEARSRQVYDPEERIYDDRKRRVTDLKECSRVTLPKPLPEKEEAEIEMRRAAQKRIYQDYKREFCDKDGNQEENLPKKVMKGIESLVKRKGKCEVIIMKTDKSSKFTITNEKEYLKMGEKHVKNDRKISRAEMTMISKILNGHSAEWAKMHNSGDSHGHKGRIVISKTTHSDNTADLSLMHKDHKEKE